MNSIKKKGGVEVKPILKDKDKEDKGLALQLVPEYVDKRSFHQGNHNPNYVFAGALYIPRDIIQIVNANDTGAAKVYMGPVRDGGNVFHSDDQSVAIEDPDVRKYINRILRYFKYDPEEAMTTLREASFKIKNRARGIVKRTYSQNTVSKLQAWRAKLQYSEGESEEDLPTGSPPVIGPKVPVTEEEEKDDLEELNKRSFIQKTFNKIFPTRSITKIDKVQKEISSSDTPHSSEGERSLRKKMKWKTKKSKSMSQLINEGNKQVTGASVKTNSLECEVSTSKQDELLLSYLTAPRIHYCDAYTVMILNSENPRNSRSQNRRKALKKMKKRLQRLETVPHHGIELDRFYNPCSMFDRMARNEKVLHLNRMLPNQQAFVCSDPCCDPCCDPCYDPCYDPCFDSLDNRSNKNNCAEFTRQSVDIIADTFVNVIESPNDPKCKVEITGQGYRGKFNVGLDPIIDEVLYNSLQNLKETYDNAKCFYETPTTDRRRNRTLSNIADNVRSYFSKVAGKNSSVRRSTIVFPSDNIIGRTSIHRGETESYEEDTPAIFYENADMKPRRSQRNNKGRCAPLEKISKYFTDNEKNKCQPKYTNCRNFRRAKKKRNINSSGSESFEERQFVRRTKDNAFPVLESSDNSFILRETSCKIDEPAEVNNRGGSTGNHANKKKTFNARDVCKESFYPDLSYISEKDWKAADEMFIKEREAESCEPVRYTSLNESKCEKSEEQSIVNSPMANNKLVKVKETMTTTTNGVTTVTQTEIIEAINQSSQCVIPSTSKDGLTARKEFNKISMKYNESRQEESNARLVNITHRTQRNMNTCEEVTSPYRIVINKENTQKIGHPQCRGPRECRCCVEEKRYLSSTISLENLGQPDPKGAQGYNDTLIINNVELSDQKDFRKCAWRKEYCHCNTNTENTYSMAREMSKMKQHLDITDLNHYTLNDTRKKVPLLHKVHSAPNTCHSKSYHENSLKEVDNKMCIKINALKEMEREHITKRKKHNLKEWTPNEKSGKQEFKTSEEVIVTESGKAKIRVSLGSCDTSQRQQAFLELMEVLKRKIESETQLMTGNSHFQAMNLHNFDDHALIKSYQPIQANTFRNNNAIKKDAFKGKKKTATVAMMTSMDECCRSRMRLCTSTLKNFEVTTKKRKPKMYCYRPCYCDEKKKCIARKSYAQQTGSSLHERPSQSLSLINEDGTKSLKSIPRRSFAQQTGSSLQERPSQSLSLINEDGTKSLKSIPRQSFAQQTGSSLQERPSLSLSMINEDVAKSLKSIPRQSFAQQTGDSLQERQFGSIPVNNEDVRKSFKPQTVSVSVQTDDKLMPSSPLNAIHLERSSSGSLSPDDEETGIPAAEPKYVSIGVQTDNLDRRSTIVTTTPKEEIPKEPPTSRKSSRLSRKSGTLRISGSGTRIKTGSLFSKSLSQKGSKRASPYRQSEKILLEKLPKKSRKSSIHNTNKKDSVRKSSGRETVRSSRRTLFVKRSTAPSVEEIKTSRDSRKSRQSRESRRSRKSRPSRESRQITESQESPESSQSRQLRESLQLRESRQSRELPGTHTQTRESQQSRESRQSRESGQLPELRQSPVINQRVWIQNMRVPLNYTDHSEVPASQNSEEVSNICYYGNETGNSIVNSKSKKMSHRRLNSIFNKKKRNYLASPYVSENNLLSRQDNRKNSIRHCFPNQRKTNKFIAAPREVSPNPGTIDSLSLIPYKKSSSFIQIIKDPNSVEDNISGPSMHSRNLTDSTSGIISKCGKESILSSDTVDKSNCSLLSYEESPSLVEYVENFQYHTSRPRAEIEHTMYSSSDNYSIKRNAINSKPQSIENSITTINETNDCNNTWPYISDTVNLQCFPETKEAIDTSPDSPPLIRKKHSRNVVPGHSSVEENFATSSGSRSIRGQKSSTSGSSDSKTTVISGPIVYKKRLAVHLQKFISKPPESNKSSISSKGKGISIASSVSGRNNSIKSQSKRCNTQIYKSRIQPGLHKINSRSVVPTASLDNTEISDDSNSLSGSYLIEFEKYSIEPSSSQTSNDQPRNNSNFSGVFVETIVDTMTAERCVTETVNSDPATVNSKKHDGKSKRERKSFNTQVFNINSTLCINDDNQNAEDTESDEANCTTIGFDPSNASLKEGNSKVAECSKFRAMDGAICSSTGWIVNNSESDPETSGINTGYSNKHSKTTRKNPTTGNTEYLMMTTDLQQSSSELLAKNKNTRRTIVHRKHTFINNEFEPQEKSRKLIHSLLQKKINPVNHESNDGLGNTSTE